MFCVLFLSMYFVVDQLGRMPTSEEIRNVEVPAKLVSFLSLQASPGFNLCMIFHTDCFVSKLMRSLQI